MKISRNWLSDFIEWNETDPMVIADRMTRCMGEVDEVELQGKYLDGCVVGRVQTIQKHPSADRLLVCHVQTNDGTKQVVCGGTNLREGMLTAFAPVGATVKWHGGETMTLSKVKLRGVESEGMICAAEEIGLETIYSALKDDGERPIMDLDRLKHQFPEISVGTPLRVALSMNDVIFHIDNHAITNRPDLFSHIGIARELVAMGIAEWKKKPTLPKVSFPKTAPSVQIKNTVTELVPHYVGTILNFEEVVATPEWMKRRLEATGWRSINLIVDITNYVLMEVGMPLHAFDAGDFRGPLTIRQAKKGESITTLDEKTRPLPEGAVIISDDDGIFDLFGVMGGLRTSSTSATRTILLQAGIIMPMSVRKTIIAMGHRTDAATVYEKGITKETARHGLLRAIQLFQELMPSTKVASSCIEWGKEKPKKAITIPSDMFSSFIGAPITIATVKKIFDSLGCTVKTSGKNLSITPPVWRSDVTMKQDLVEEVARIYGYANIAPTMPEASIALAPRDHRINHLRAELKNARFTEFLHLAFSNPQALNKCHLDAHSAISIENPIGAELSLMRTSLLPSLLETLSKEMKTVEKTHLKAYEYGRTFMKGKPEALDLCAIVSAKGTTTIADDPSLILTSDIVRSFSALGYTLQLQKASADVAPFAHGGRSAEISIGTTTVGFITELHPSVRSAYDLPGRVSVAIIHLDAVRNIPASTLIVAPIPAFPAIEFDETMILGTTPHAEIVERAKKIDPLLRDIRTLHFYEANGVKNVTLRFTYRSDDRTLIQADTEKVHAKVMGELRKL